MKQCLCEKCWKGYVKRGYKTLFGKRYPNCVKKSKAGKRRESVKEAERKMSSLEMQQIILLAKAMKQMPGSPAQKKIKQQIQDKTEDLKTELSKILAKLKKTEEKSQGDETAEHEQPDHDEDVSGKENKKSEKAPMSSEQKRSLAIKVFAGFAGIMG